MQYVIGFIVLGLLMITLVKSGMELADTIVDAIRK